MTLDRWAVQLQQFKNSMATNAQPYKLGTESSKIIYEKTLPRANIMSSIEIGFTFKQYILKFYILQLILTRKLLQCLRIY